MNEQAHLIDLTATDSPDTLRQAAGVVLAMVGLTGQPSLTPLPGGGNNRVYRVDVAGRSLVLKTYFQHPDDPRDRLDAEFTFLKHAWSMGVRCVPQPVARLPLRHLALYGLLPGQPWVSDKSVRPVTADHVRQAADFARAIQPAQPASPDASDTSCPLADASDGCFSLAEHLAGIEHRLTKLALLEPGDALDKQAIAFTTQKLIPAWQCAAKAVWRQAESLGLCAHEPLPRDKQVVSPSDFGFHNALMGDDGQVRFLDFEYAGWDDPAKLVCDFFTQVAAPVPACHLPVVLDRFVASLPDAAVVTRRIGLLMPLYRLKWCTMTLNVFLPITAARRSFAGVTGDAQDLRAGLLEKAHDLLEQYETLR